MRVERFLYWRVTSFVLLTKYYWVYHVKEEAMDSVRVTEGAE